MKKLSVYALIASIPFMFAACTPAPETEPAVAPVESAPPPATPPTLTPATVAPLEEVGYVDIAALVDGKAACFLGAVNGDPVGEQVEVKRGQAYTLEGWTADSDLEIPSKVEVVVANGERGYLLPASLGPDVRFNAAQTLGKPALANAGYTSSTDFSGVPEGEYLVFIRQHTNAGTHYCPISARRLLVR